MTGGASVRGPAVASPTQKPHEYGDPPKLGATWALAAGVSVFTLSRRMGTSLAMIDATYGHLAPDAEEQERTLLDAFDSFGRGSDTEAGTR